jgi:NodT family efflux transporter outer membrane factor (OMF) lipoprotein
MKILFKWKQALFFTVFLILPVTACTVHKPIKDVEPEVKLSGSFSIGQSLPPIDRWWKEFDNTELDLLIDEVLSENLTLRIAWARLDQARQVAKIAGAGRYPNLELGLGTQHQHTGGAFPVYSQGSDTFSATLTLGYQMDLWKKIENTRLAAVLDFEAGREDLDAIALTLAANTAELWVSLMEQKALLRLLEEQLEAGNRFLKLVESRFGQGISSAVDVYQQRLQVENIKAQFPKTRMQQKLLEHQLAIMLGRQPSAVIPIAGIDIPQVKDLPPTGIPADVLKNRPDVRAAELRLIAADHRLAAAIADRFPSISLSATAGVQSGEISNIFDEWFTNLAGNLLAPVFDAGRRKAEDERNRAVVSELFYKWESVLLGAFAEVEDALVSEEELLKIYTSTLKQVELAEQTLERSRSLYINGLTDYLTVLTSLQALQNLERAEISIRKTLISNRVKLHSALGGTWPGELMEPESAPVVTKRSGG